MWADLTEQAALVRSGAVSASELVDAAIERVQGGAELNVLVHEQFDEARREAAAIGAGDERPFAGVPFLLKDLGEPDAGRPERMGSRALRDHVAAETAWTVRRYRAAGLIVCGRTNTPEFGNHCATEPALFGPTLNPWDRRLSPGGSSGGSAAAVAAGLVGAASGGDGTGSIRMPASCCGLVGLKPRRARSSFAPGAGQALDGLAVKHALTRTVRDTAALLDVTAGTAPGDPYTAPPPPRPFVAEVGADGRVGSGLRIVHAQRPPFPGQVDPRVQAVADAAALVLEQLGHHVTPGTVDVDAAVLRRAISVIHAVDNASTFRWLQEGLGRDPEPEELDPVTWDMVREGLSLTAVAHAAAVESLHAQSRRAAAIFDQTDVVLCPTLNRLPPPPGTLSAARGSVDAFFDVELAATGWTALANATGWAAISLPLGESEGLPVGVQLLAPDEGVLLRLAGQLEVAMPWAGRRPPELA